MSAAADTEICHVPVSKFASWLTRLPVGASEGEAEWVRLDIGGGCSTKVKLWLEDGEGIEAQLDEEDVSVLDAACSLYVEAPDAWFTIPELARAMGIRSHSDSIETAIMGSLRKLTRVRVRLDYQGAKKWKKLDEGGLVDMQWTGRLVALEAEKGPDGAVRTLRMIAVPATLHDALTLGGQIRTFPTDLLWCCGGRMSRRRQVLMRLLVLRLFAIGHGGSRVIRLVRSPRRPDQPTILESAGINVAHRPSKKKAVDLITSALRSLASDGVIDGYRLVREGCALAAIEVECEGAPKWECRPSGNAAQVGTPPAQVGTPPDQTGTRPAQVGTPRSAEGAVPAGGRGCHGR